MKRLRRIKLDFFIGFGLTGLFTIFMLVALSPLEKVEDRLYDYRFKIRGPIQPPESVIIAAIDEKSLETLGRWPWGREKMARLVKKLTEGGAEIIVFDTFFFESEKNDHLLGRTIQEAGNVLLPVVFDFSQKQIVPEDELLLHSAFRSILHPEKFNQYSPILAQRPLLPVPEVLRESMAVGHVNLFPENDGTLRWEAMAVECNGYLYPSIGLKAAAIYLGVPNEKVILEATEGIKLGKKRYIPTDRYGRSLILYYGPAQTFTYLSISDILDGTTSAEHFRGKIVLIGATAVGVHDLKVTPSSPAMPGVEKHAHVISSILEGRFLRKITLFANVAILLGTGSLFSFWVSRMKAVGASFLTVISVLMIFASGYYLFAYQGLWIHTGYPAINILLIFVMVTAYHYATEEKYARRIRTMFSSYVTERVVNELVKNPGMAKLGGERREVTVLFSDIRDFTSFSEKHTPEEVVNILNEYLGSMTDVIFRWEGTLDKFVGDGIVAFWGAPMRQQNHAELAMRCALHMERRLKELQRKWQSEGKEILDAGMGLNTGEVLVGNIGAEGKKMDYTVIGDHVNLGARVESLTRQHQTRILITEFTLRKIEELIAGNHIGHVSLRKKEKVVLKGMEKMVEIYEVQNIDHRGFPQLSKSED